MKCYVKYFTIIILFTMFSILSVFAEEKKLTLENISIKEKSISVGVSKLKTNNGEVDNNMFFNKVGDYIVYDVLIKNNSGKNYTIRNISDDSSSEYITYDYTNYENKLVEAGKSITINIKATYSNQSPTRVLNNGAVHFTILYDDEEGVPDSSSISNDVTDSTNDSIITNNPIVNNISNIVDTINNVKTGDFIIFYIIIFIFSLIGLVSSLLLKKKCLKNIFIITLCLGIVLPFSVKADSNILMFKVNNDIIEQSVSYLKTGREVNATIISLASGEDVHWVNKGNNYELFKDTYLGNTYDDSLSTDDFNNYVFNYSDQLTSFEFASLDQYNNIKASLTEKNIVSTDDSTVPIYLWIDNNVIYYYTENDIIFMNNDSKFLFALLSNVSNFDLDRLNSSNVNDMEYLFYLCSSVADLNLSKFDTSSVTNMGSIFYKCSSLTNLDISNFDTSKVIDMDYMFYACSHLTSIDVSGFNTSNVVDMSGMFYQTGVTDLDLSNFNTSNVEDMSLMFTQIRNLTTLDLSNFDTSNVTNMQYMFFGMYALDDLNVSSFDTSNVTNMFYMFGYDYAIKSLDLSNFDTKNVVNMARMFWCCKDLEVVDISNFDTSSVENFGYLFYMCSELKTIYASDKFVPIYEGTMFSYDENLVGGSGTTYDSNHITSAYAHIDGGVDNPGYFTLKQ